MQYDFLFPGQGAQYCGMGHDLYEKSEGVRRLFRIVDRHAHFDVRQIIFGDSDEALQATDKTQIAVTLINLSAACVLRERGVVARSLAGFSLGEYAALVEAGVLTLDDVFSIVRIRGELMEEVSRTFDGESGKSGMAAVIGLPFDAVRTTVADAGIRDLYPAIHNSPKQTVIAGTAASLAAAEEPLTQAGALRYVPLRVSGPFHTPLMEEARKRFAVALERVEFRDPTMPVYSNVSAQRIATGTEARRLCTEQLTSTVLWTDEQLALLMDGGANPLEVGPGTVLTGLWRALARAYPDRISGKCRPAGTLEQIEQLV